ncbi:MAG: hypothetical protein IJ783_05025 [Kiritimatiellae bacterium]|nr:hypothetical protein [Kiritimatiellia bacterium]
MTFPRNHLFSFFTPSAVAASAAGLAAFAVRRPRLFFRLAAAAARDRAALVRLLRLPIDAETVRSSPRFDAAWYASRHPECAAAGLEPWLHHLLFDRSPDMAASPSFSGAAYFAANPELRDCGVHPLVHYEQYGRFTGLPVSPEAAAAPPPPPPPGSVEAVQAPAATGTAADSTLPPGAGGVPRVAVFAVWFPGGRIPETDLLYLRALRDVAAHVVVVGNCRVLPGETEKLRGLADGFSFRVHGGYDFGSYRIGLRLAEETGLLAPGRCAELVLANDSCYAPLRPFSEMFGAMARRKCDFWGVTENRQFSHEPHLQSYFLVFRRKALDGGALRGFLGRMPERTSRRDAVALGEIPLTGFMRERGLVPAAFVPRRFSALRDFNPTTATLALVRRCRVPMVKAKALRGESRDDPARIMREIRRASPALAEAIERSR